jgi:phage terminase large subunit GpA-like protein
MTTPVDRRFVADAEAHRRDAPRFCPSCGGGLAIATEFWEADDRRFYCSCTGCGWTGEITPTGSVAVGHEPDH